MARDYLANANQSNREITSDTKLTTALIKVITLRYAELRCVACIALRSVALRCVALRCVALRCIALFSYCIVFTGRAQDCRTGGRVLKSSSDW